MDELNKLKASLDLLSEAVLELQIKKSKKEYDDAKRHIKVPECIKIESCCGGGDNLGIVFKDKVSLSYADCVDFYRVSCVTTISVSDFVQCRLRKLADGEELETGHTYYLSMKEYKNKNDINCIENYVKWLGNNTYCSFSEEGDVFILHDHFHREEYDVYAVEEENEEE